MGEEERICYRNLVQFIGYEGPPQMSEGQFRAFWDPLCEPYLTEPEGGVNKIILSQHRSGYFDFGALPYMYLSKNWWASTDESKVTLLSGRSGKVGHVSINQLGIFLLRESKTKNSKLYSHLPHTVDRDIIKLMGMVSVDQTKCDLSEPSMLAERMGKVAGYHCHSIYELHPVAREYHTQKRRNKEMKDKERPWMFCPCRVAGWVVEVYYNVKTVDHRGVCEAADKFNQTFKHWKFAFHKDQDMVEYHQSHHQTEEALDDEIQMTSV